MSITTEKRKRKYKEKRYSDIGLMSRRQLFGVYDTLNSDICITVGNIHEVSKNLNCSKRLVWIHAQKGGLISRRYRIESLGKEIEFEDDYYDENEDF